MTWLSVIWSLYFQCHPGCSERESYFLSNLSYSFLVSGSPDTTDSIGDGVMRQVIDTALHKCLRWTSEVHGDISTITGDTSITLDDNFVSLKLKLSRFPTVGFGCLCALYLLKVCNAPHPITPDIFSLIINGAFCLIDSDSINEHDSFIDELLVWQLVFFQGKIWPNSQIRILL
jgi:hypothetical protein